MIGYSEESDLAPPEHLSSDYVQRRVTFRLAETAVKYVPALSVIFFSLPALVIASPFVL
jgi:hypothetical protein